MLPRCSPDGCAAKFFDPSEALRVLRALRGWTGVVQLAKLGWSLPVSLQQAQFQELLVATW